MSLSSPQPNHDNVERQDPKTDGNKTLLSLIHSLSPSSSNIRPIEEELTRTCTNHSKGVPQVAARIVICRQLIADDNTVVALDLVVIKRDAHLIQWVPDKTGAIVVRSFLFQRGNTNGLGKLAIVSKRTYL